MHLGTGSFWDNVRKRHGWSTELAPRCKSTGSLQHECRLVDILSLLVVAANCNAISNRSGTDLFCAQDIFRLSLLNRTEQRSEMHERVSRPRTRSTSPGLIRPASALAAHPAAG